MLGKTYQRIFFIFIPLTLLFSASLCFAQHKTNMLLKITISPTTNPELMLKNVNLKQKIIQLTLPDKQPEHFIDVWLKTLAAKSVGYKAIAGIAVNANEPLDHNAATSLATLIKKASYLSMKISLDDASDWHLIFENAPTNAHLLTVVLGANAIAQLQQHPKLARNLVMSNIPFLHIFTAATNDNNKNTVNFWQRFAKAARQHKTPIIIALFDSGSNTIINYNNIVKQSLTLAQPYLFWIGDNNQNTFVAAHMNAATLVVWHVNPQGNIVANRYQRSLSPMSMYAAFGTTQTAFQGLSQLIQRAQYANQHGIHYLGDATDHLHQSGVLSRLTNTAICDADVVYLPQRLKSSGMFNLLINLPSKIGIQQIANSKIIKNNLAQALYLGIFDYSLNAQNTAALYGTIHQMLTANQGFNVAYDAANVKVATTIKHALEGTQVKQVDGVIPQHTSTLH